VRALPVVGVPAGVVPLAPAHLLGGQVAVERDDLAVRVLRAEQHVRRCQRAAPAVQLDDGGVDVRRLVDLRGGRGGLGGEPLLAGRALVAVVLDGGDAGGGRGAGG